MLRSLIVASYNDVAEFPDTKYWWPSCMCDIFLASRNVPETYVSLGLVLESSNFNRNCFQETEKKYTQLSHCAKFQKLQSP